MLSLFRLVWDPNDPTKVSSEENDLEVFYGDEDFKYLHSLPAGAREAVKKVEALLIGPNRTQIEEIPETGSSLIQ